MLRLEQVRKSRDISISLRQKEPFFNAIFCLAMGWALGAHLCVFLLFYIAPFKINYSDSIFPPVAVVSDLGKARDANALALVEEEIAIPQHLIPPLIGDLATPSIPLNLPRKDWEFKAPFSPFHPFLSAEKELLTHGNVFVEAAAPSPLKVLIAGPLAGFESEKCDFFIPASFQNLQKRDYEIAFDVRVDGNLGQIIWLQARGKANPIILQWSEKIIKDMRFKNTASEMVIPGLVEFFISLSPKEAL